jgi:hypothetical protein
VHAGSAVTANGTSARATSITPPGAEVIDGIMVCAPRLQPPGT